MTAEQALMAIFEHASHSSKLPAAAYPELVVLKNIILEKLKLADSIRQKTTPGATPEKEDT